MVHDAINKNILFFNKKKKVFITIWISKVLSEELGQRNKPFLIIDYTSNKKVQPTNNKNIDMLI